MAGIGPVNGVTNVQVRPVQTASAPSPERVSGADRLRQDNVARVQEATEKKTEQKKEELQDVIAVSKDGDTVQAGQEARELLDEDRFGKVTVVGAETENETAEEAIRTFPPAEEEVNTQAFPPAEEEDEAAVQAFPPQEKEEVNPQTFPPEEKEEVNPQTFPPKKDPAQEAAQKEAEKKAEQRAEELKEAVEERAEKTKERIKAQTAEKNPATVPQDQENEAVKVDKGSLKGYTEAQLKQLFEKGEISRTDYDAEIKKREEVRGNEQQENAEFSREMVQGIALNEQAAQEGEAIENAFEQGGNDTIAPKDRLDMMEAVNNNDSI